MIKKRTTVYLNEKLRKLLKLRSIRTNQSTSEYLNQLVYQDLMEEQEDLADITKILKEPTVPFDKVLKDLRLEKEV